MRSPCCGPLSRRSGGNETGTGCKLKPKANGRRPNIMRTRAMRDASDGCLFTGRAARRRHQPRCVFVLPGPRRARGTLGRERLARGSRFQWFSPGGRVEGSGLRLRAQAVLLVFIYVLTRRRGANTAHTQREGIRSRHLRERTHTNTRKHILKHSAVFHDDVLTPSCQKAHP